MPTVMLTTHCPNACEWCFARPKMEEYQSRGIHEMSWDDFISVVDFYERSGFRWMALLGGEPAWHSRFMDILRYLHERDFSILVVTTGILPGPLVQQIADEGLPRLEFAVNSTSYFHYGEDKRKKVDDFLRRLGRVTSIGYTITERDAVEKKIEPVLDRIAMIMKFGLIRRLQIQIAVPGERNSLFVPFERYGNIAELLVAWFRILRKNCIISGLDCHCMPACSIPADLRGTDFFHSKCDRFMIDIGPDLDIWPCFPLSDQIGRLAQFNNLNGIYEHFSKLNRSHQIIYDESCGDCAERRSGSCHGGCRGFQHIRRRLPDKEINEGSGMAERHNTHTPSLQFSVRRTAPCV
jgi:MoaA/NifB/PqqE/SkfB family radical SAM enzyme